MQRKESSREKAGHILRELYAYRVFVHVLPRVRVSPRGSVSLHRASSLSAPPIFFSSRFLFLAHVSLLSLSSLSLSLFFPICLSVPCLLARSPHPCIQRIFTPLSSPVYRLRSLPSRIYLSCIYLTKRPRYLSSSLAVICPSFCPASYLAPSLSLSSVRARARALVRSIFLILSLCLSPSSSRSVFSFVSVSLFPCRATLDYITAHSLSVLCLRTLVLRRATRGLFWR